MLTLSIVIPALNEAAGIAVALTHLQPLRARGAEVIVVDGGSTDETRAQAAPLADAVLTSPPGRAGQMNAGARLARGEVLFFLHADSRPPDDADHLIARALARRAWGRFNVWIDGRHAFLPVIAWCMNRRSCLTGIATGDQGIFVTRAAFEGVGGFPDQPLMEDIEISKRLKALSYPACVRGPLVTSGRRWDTHGVWRTILLMWRLRWRYWRGADPHALHAQYHGR